MERIFNLDDFSVRFKFDLDRPYEGIKAFWEPRIPNEAEMQHLLPLYMDVQHPSVIDGLTSNWST
jgi:hypothetical protein